MGILSYIIFSIAAIASGFIFIVAIKGSFKFPDALSRGHALGMIDTLGIFIALIGLMFLNGHIDSNIFKMVVILFLFWFNNMVSGHLISHFSIEQQEIKPLNDKQEVSENFHTSTYITQELTQFTVVDEIIDHEHDEHDEEENGEDKSSADESDVKNTENENNHSTKEV